MDESSFQLESLSAGQTSGYQTEPVTHIARERFSRSESGQVQEFSLPPTDSGKDAWLFLAGCFMTEALVWGFPFSFGIFQDYYSTHEPFQGSSNVAVIGTTALGVMYLGAPLTFAAMQNWPKIRRPSGAVGLSIMIISLIASSFSETVAHLILTQGVLYAIGGSLIYAPTILYLDEWFVRRKGFAFGVMWAGTGLAGVILPLIFDWGLEKYGFRTILRAWSVGIFILTAPLLYFVKPRLPAAISSVSRRFDFAFLTSPIFVILQVGNVIEGLGYFIPSIYLPTYARSLGASRLAGTVTVVLFNVMSVVGCLIMGALTDRYDVTTCLSISAIGAAASVFFFWGFSVSLPVLCIFALSYGLFAGSYTSIWPGILKEIQRQKAGTEIGMIFAMLAAGRGVGSVVAGPLSEAILKGSNKGDGTVETSAYASGYAGLVIFTGVTAMLGGLGFVGKKVGWL